MSSDQARLKRAQSGDSIVEKVTSVQVIKDSTEFLRQKSEANVADAQAKVDRTTSELISARNGLKWAQRGLNTVDNVTGVVSDIMAPPEYDAVVPAEEEVVAPQATPEPESSEAKED